MKGSRFYKFGRQFVWAPCITAFLVPLTALAQDYEVPLTQWGQPDLQGVWNFSSDVPMQRPSQYGTRQFLTQEEIAAMAAARAARDASTDAALGVGTGAVDESYNDFWVENAGIGDNVRTSHIVYPNDGRLPDIVDGAIRNQGVYGGATTGESRGYYDGDTLVVVTKNFNGLAPSFGSTGTSAEKTLTEKFTRVDYDTVDYEFTVNDPATYTDHFTAIVPMTKVAGQIYEYACHEGNYGMVNILHGARVEERLEAEASQ